MARTRKPTLEFILSGRSLQVAAAVASKRWPGVRLGYLGTDSNTFQHYFQEIGNPQPFIL
jgi:hypothetical protein